MLTDYGSQAAQRGVELRIVPSRLVLTVIDAARAEYYATWFSNANSLHAKRKSAGRASARWSDGEKSRSGIQARHTRGSTPENFEEFYQTSQSRSAIAARDWWGLAIVQRLTRLLDHPLYGFEVARGRYSG